MALSPRPAPSALLGLAFLWCTTLGWGMAGAAEGPFLTGLRETTPVDQAWMEANAINRLAPTKDATTLPDAVRNIEFLPEVNRQTLPNCGAYAPTYYLKTYQEARKHGWGRVNPWTHPERAMSPGVAYLFGQSDINGGSITGSIRVMCEVGILGLDQLPDTYNYDRTVFPSATMLLEAMPYRAEGIVQLEARSDDGFLALKEWLASGELAVFALDISQATHDYGRLPAVPDVDNGVIHGLGGPRLDFHAFTLIGYDDNRAYVDGTGPKQGAFLAVNSWGQNWGVEVPEAGTRGFLWVGYDYFRAASVGDVYSMTEREDDEIRWVGVFQYEHPHSPQVVHSFRAGNPDSPQWTRTFPPTNPSESAKYEKVRPLVVDLTGEDGVDPEAIWWRPLNTGAIPGLPHPSAKGTAHGFRILRYEDARAAFAGPLFQSGNTHYWRTVALEGVDVPSLAMEGLPVESVIIPNIQDLPVGFLDGGGAILDPPLVHGSALFADLNRNGLPDLLVVGSTTQLYENTGGGFRLVQNHGIGEYGWAAAAFGDYNRDGLPDLAICGSQGSTKVTRVYRNLGGFRFQDSGAEITGVAGSMLSLSASIAWGDYDNDGLEDLAFWGFDQANRKHIHVYRNRGDGGFEPVPFTLPERHGAQLSWVDVNANGLLDLCAGSAIFFNQGDGTLTTVPVGLPPGGLWGDTPDQGIWADFTGDGLPDLARVYSRRINLPGGAITTSEQVQIYRNTGDGTLEHTGVTLEGLQYPRLDAADYNNNGLMDLASAHYTGGGGSVGGSRPRSTALFRQLPDGTFRDAGHALLATAEGAVGLADVDGDGDLDLLTTGYIQTTDGSWQRGARLYRSRFAQSPWGSAANTPPAPPVNLSVSRDEATGEFVFMWDHGSDTETPQPALAYNIRIGTWSGGANILSPASSAPITSQVRQHRISADQPGLILRGLPPAYYYWSVRTVDGGRRASEWAPEQTFALLDGFILEDFNLDGVFDAADVATFARMVREQSFNLPLDFDFNKDGRISQADPRTLALQLAGSDSLFPGSYPIGPEGGVIEQDGIEIAVPPGAFPEIAVLSIEMLDPDTTGLVEMYEDYEPQGAIELYEITGAPLVTDGPWYITLQPYGPTPGMPVVLMGEESFAFEGADVGMRYRLEEPEVLADGRYRITVPRMDDADGLKRSDNENTYTFNVGFFNLGSIAKYSGPRFAIYFPKAYVGAEIENLMQGFEDAYRILRDGYGFSYARRTRWPIEVYVKKVPPPRPGGEPPDGEMITVTRGINHGYINIHIRILENLEKSRATACHEFFHVVQGLYDPAGRVTQAWRSTYARYWLDEAMSTWSEELVVSNRPHYIPSTYMDNIEAPFLGVGYGIHGDNNKAPEHGYGMAPLVKYLVDSGRTGAPEAVYWAALAGSDPVEALEAAVTDLPLRIWYDDFFRQLIEGKIYPYDKPAQVFLSLAGGPRRLRLEPGISMSWRRFDVSLPDLAAAPYPAVFTLDYPDPPADAFFVIRFEGDPMLGLQFFRVPEEEQAARVASSFGATEIKYGTIPNALQYGTNRYQLLTLVSNTSTNAPYTEEREGTLAIGLARPGPFPLETNSLSGYAYGRSFPSMTGTGTLTADAVSDLIETAGGGSFHMVQAGAWGRETVDVTLEYQATVDELTDTWQSGSDTHTLSTTGIASYKLVQSGEGGAVMQTQANETGSFQVTLGPEDRERGYGVFTISAVYPLSYSVNGTAISSTNQEWPLAVFVIHLP